MTLAERSLGWFQASQDPKQEFPWFGLPVIDGLRLLKALA
jgi:hypothetical protein